MKIQALKTRLFKEKEDLVSFIFEHVTKIPENSILVVTSKIVALAQGRTASVKDKEKLILTESSFATASKYAWLTIKDGIVMASAGIDESNANGRIILLPKNPYEIAAKIHKALTKHFKVKKFGVIISDSNLLPMRAGVIGIAHGYFGFKGVKSYKGIKDLFGRRFKFSTVNIADSIATSATLLMGEGKERRPLALVTNAPAVFTKKVNKKEIRIPLEKDLYGQLFKKYEKKK